MPGALLLWSERRLGANGVMVIVPEPAIFCFVPALAKAADAVADLVRVVSLFLWGLFGKGFRFGT